MFVVCACVCSDYVLVCSVCRMYICRLLCMYFCCGCCLYICCVHSCSMVWWIILEDFHLAPANAVSDCNMVKGGHRDMMGLVGGMGEEYISELVNTTML